jgi:hypothetical protein
MAARTPTAKPVTDVGKCRGKWSVCKGVNPSRSLDWHLCQDCTEKRAVRIKSGKADPKVKAPAKTAGTTREVVAVRKAPAPKREPVARVAGIVVPEPIVKVTAKS